jgi:hypothetical protein
MIDIKYILNYLDIKYDTGHGLYNTEWIQIRALYSKEKIMLYHENDENWSQKHGYWYTNGLLWKLTEYVY